MTDSTLAAKIHGLKLCCEREGIASPLVASAGWFRIRNMSASFIVDSQVTVETPEGVDFRFRIAGPGRRGVAFIFDWLIKIAIIWCISIMSSVLGLFGEAGEGMAGGILLVTIFFTNWLYSALFEMMWDGQTPGKKAAKIRVVRSNGTPLGPYEAFGRNLLLGADAFPGLYTVGLISMLLTPRMQRLGDLIFDTMVIYQQRERIKVDPFVGVKPLLRSECPLRFDVPDRTLSVIEALFDSGRVVAPTRKEELATLLSVELRKRLGYHEPQQAINHTRFLQKVLLTFGGATSKSVTPPPPQRTQITPEIATGTETPVPVPTAHPSAPPTLKEIKPNDLQDQIRVVPPQPAPPTLGEDNSIREGGDS